MIQIDGRQGEGGGQVLRTSLALSVALGQPFRIEHIRANRKKGGLLRQHLTAVRAAAEISGAEVTGAELGSTELELRPGAVRAGEYRFAVGSAGSAMLVLQTVLVPLCLADRESTLLLEGGTHNPWAPPFPFLVRSFLPLLERMGASVQAELVRPGFYPAGGGEVLVQIQPVRKPLPFELLERGPQREKLVEIFLAHLPEHIAEREWKELNRTLQWRERRLTITDYPESRGPGNTLCVELAFKHVTELVTGFGEKNVRAKQVADRAGREVRRYLDAGVPVGEHLADQLMLPLALFAGGRYRTLAPSPHATTNAEVIAAFLGEVVTFEVNGKDDVLVEVLARS